MRNLWHTWWEFWKIYRTVERARDLQGLIRWARRKRLTGVRKAYEYKLVREMMSLKAADNYYPEITRMARFIYRVNEFLVPEPVYYPAGSASRFKGN